MTLLRLVNSVFDRSTDASSDLFEGDFGKDTITFNDNIVIITKSLEFILFIIRLCLVFLLKEFITPKFTLLSKDGTSLLLNFRDKLDSVPS
jgi:hypothetical protein